MRRGNRRQLTEIFEVRAVQRQAAELRVAEANRAIARLDERRNEQEEILEDDQRRWQMALSAPSLSLPMLRAWSAEILRGEADLRQTDVELERAQAVKADRSQTWHVASALADATEELAERAKLAERRRLEEAQINDVADRFAHRVAPW